MKHRNPHGAGAKNRAASRIDVEIDELALDGFESRDRFRIADAVERELARLLRAKGPPLSWMESGEIFRWEGNQFGMKTGQREETIGARIAELIYRGWPR